VNVGSGGGGAGGPGLSYKTPITGGAGGDGVSIFNGDAGIPPTYGTAAPASFSSGRYVGGGGGGGDLGPVVVVLVDKEEEEQGSFLRVLLLNRILVFQVLNILAVVEEVLFPITLDLVDKVVVDLL
jgi:hypothetical protein